MSGKETSSRSSEKIPTSPTNSWVFDREIRKSPFPNRAASIASVSATGGSTNAVLHLLAIAREAGVELSLADFDRISAKTPVYADLKPSGRFVANDLFNAGGGALVAQRLANAKLLNPAAKTVTGKSIGEEAAAADVLV